MYNLDRNLHTDTEEPPEYTDVNGWGEEDNDGWESEWLMEQLDEQKFTTSKQSGSSSMLAAAPPDKAIPLLTPQKQIQLVREVKARLKLLKEGVAEQQQHDTDWLESVAGALLSVDQFRAGSTRQHIQAWKHGLQTEISKHRQLSKS